MTLRSIGGLAAFICAGTYVFGFIFLATQLIQLGYGTNAIDAVAVVEFIRTNQGLMITWNTGIYIVNGLALVVLVASVNARLRAERSDWASVALGFGWVWSTLVLGAGMVANTAVERAAILAATDPQQAALIWDMLHAVELGLGGGNEIVGSVWIACVSLAAWRGASLGKITNGLGIVTGIGGCCTLVPAWGDAAGAVFGLGAIAWFLSVGINLLWRSPSDGTHNRVTGTRNAF